MKTNKLTLQNISTETKWDSLSFIKVFDRLIAANVFVSEQRGVTLYNNEFNRFLAEKLAPIDGGLSESFLGVVDIQENRDEPWRSVPETVEPLLCDKPRGAWAIFRYDGGYDAYMSDGHGGVCTETGRGFPYPSSANASLTFEAVYAHVWGWSAYSRRNEIESEVYAVSAASGAEGCTEVRNKRVNGKEWDRLTYHGEDDHGYCIRMTRRGRKACEAHIAPRGLVRLFNLPLVMPDRFDGVQIDENLSPAMRSAAV